jgi:hemolysin III
VINKLKKTETVNFLTHFVGAILMASATIFLAYTARKESLSLAVAIIYGACSTLLFTASALYHLNKKEENERSVWRTIDHMSIYIMIAGTYTPICALVFNNVWGITIASVQWGLAIVGFLSEMFWIRRPRWLSTGLYMAMGWVVVSAILPLVKGLSCSSLVLLVSGGIIYSTGALIYALKKPNPLPGIYGFHEIFHTMVFVANAIYFVMIFKIIIG